MIIGSCSDHDHTFLFIYHVCVCVCICFEKLCLNNTKAVVCHQQIRTLRGNIEVFNELKARLAKPICLQGYCVYCVYVTYLSFWRDMILN